MGKRRTVPTPDPNEVKTDGLGKPLLDEAEYYVQDARGFVGNCISWWAVNGAGYVCNLDEAGVYTGAHAKELRGTDVPWPVEYVRTRVVKHVRGDVQAFDRQAHGYKAGPRS